MLPGSILRQVLDWLVYPCEGSLSLHRFDLKISRFELLWQLLLYGTSMSVVQLLLLPAGVRTGLLLLLTGNGLAGFASALFISTGRIRSFTLGSQRLIVHLRNGNCDAQLRRVICHGPWLILLETAPMTHQPRRPLRPAWLRHRRILVLPDSLRTEQRKTLVAMLRSGTWVQAQGQEEET